MRRLIFPKSKVALVQYLHLCNNKSVNKATISVRDSRKQETLSLIHDIAKTLVLEKGLSDVRVEDIADAAGISRRTFFNYFPTKEDAVLGLQPPTLSDTAVARFNDSHDDIITRTTRLTVDVIRTTTVAGSTAQHRRRLRRRFPELIQRFELRTKTSEELIRPIIESCVQQDTQASTHETDVILGLSAAIIRLTYQLDHEVRDESVTNTLQLFKNTLRKKL